MDGRTDRQTDRQADRQVDSETEVNITFRVDKSLCLPKLKSVLF